MVRMVRTIAVTRNRLRPVNFGLVKAYLPVMEWLSGPAWYQDSPARESAAVRIDRAAQDARDAHMAKGLHRGGRMLCVLDATLVVVTTAWVDEPPRVVANLVRDSRGRLYIGESFATETDRMRWGLPL